MPEKPRVKAPRARTTHAAKDTGGRRRLALGALGVAGVAALAAVALFVLLGSGETTEDSARSDLKAAGCTVRDFPGVSRQHISDPAARPKSWNSFPPTSGPHYVTPAVYGLYSEPIELARILHGLEHGGVYMLYGSKAPADTAARVRAIYDEDPRGLVVAPLPELGKRIALGAWTSDDPGSAEVGTGHLATCTQVDTKAFEGFIEAFRGRGPEGVPLNLMQPGGT